MGTKSALPVIGEADAAGGRLTRREMVRRLVAAAGAGTAWPLVAASHPIHEILRNDAALEEAERLGTADWKPLFLDAQQNESLTAIAESIVPGSASAEAQVNRFIDLLLGVDTDKHKHEFVEALAAFEGEAKERFAKNFAALDESQKSQVLADASATSAKENSGGAGAGEKSAGLSGHFENLKGWVVGAYYSSEKGMRELGWTPDRVFASFPSCEHPEGHY